MTHTHLWDEDELWPMIAQKHTEGLTLFVYRSPDGDKLLVQAIMETDGRVLLLELEVPRDG